MQSIKQQAATALDRTHKVGERGPKTYNAREKLGRWLNGQPVSKNDVKSAIRWLMALEVSNEDL